MRVQVEAGEAPITWLGRRTGDEITRGASNWAVEVLGWKRSDAQAFGRWFASRRLAYEQGRLQHETVADHLGGIRLSDGADEEMSPRSALPLYLQHLESEALIAAQHPAVAGRGLERAGSR